MNQYTVKISDEEKKVLEGDMFSIQEWVENVILNKARKCINRIVIKETGRNPEKFTKAEKLQIVRDAEIIPLKDITTE